MRCVRSRPSSVSASSILGSCKNLRRAVIAVATASGCNSATCAGSIAPTARSISAWGAAPGALLRVGGSRGLQPPEKVKLIQRALAPGLVSISRNRLFFIEQLRRNYPCRFTNTNAHSAKSTRKRSRSSPTRRSRNARIAEACWNASSPPRPSHSKEEVGSRTATEASSQNPPAKATANPRAIPHRARTPLNRPLHPAKPHLLLPAAMPSLPRLQVRPLHPQHLPALKRSESLRVNRRTILCRTQEELSPPLSVPRIIRSQWLVLGSSPSAHCCCADFRASSLSSRAQHPCLQLNCICA